ncbi:MAG: polysaccharide deacetylase family protein [Desulfobacterales bacterium]|nr:MAG: polysaccharide deacetylase family protein [Desulfobacterales bacterium]
MFVRGQKQGHKFKSVFWIGLLVFTACTTLTRERPYSDFVVVQVREGDCLEDLAAHYLSDPTQDWLIAEFNGLDAANLTPDKQLVIPLKAFDKGGLRPNGYQTVPVLRYQRFSRTPVDPMVVTQTDFDAQMHFLKDNGYRVITLDQFFDFINFKSQVPPKAVVITIDDGWRTTLEIAWPILKKYGFPATIFINPDFILNPEALSWKQIRQLSRGGIDIQCRTRLHRRISDLKDKESFETYIQELEKELTRSKAIIRRELNQDCKYLAYPGGDANNLIVALAKKHGFQAAFTLNGQSNPFFVDNYLIGRSAVYGSRGLEQFRKILAVFASRNLE